MEEWISGIIGRVVGVGELEDWDYGEDWGSGIGSRSWRSVMGGDEC